MTLSLRHGSVTSSLFFCAALNMLAQWISIFFQETYVSQKPECKHVSHSEHHATVLSFAHGNLLQHAISSNWQRLFFLLGKLFKQWRPTTTTPHKNNDVHTATVISIQSQNDLLYSPHILGTPVRELCPIPL